MANWAQAILAGIGAPASAGNMAKMSAWNACEGNAAGGSGLPINNPFNTTQAYAGAPAVNSDGVRYYPSLSAGITATIRTLQYPRYSAVVSNLRSNGSGAQFASALGASGWGTNGACVAGKLSSGDIAPVGGPSVSPSTGGGLPPQISETQPNQSGTSVPGGADTAPSGSGSQPGGSGTPGGGSTCLWSMSLLGCALTKSQARALIGGAVILAGGIIVIIGADLLMKAAGLGGSGTGKAVRTAGEFIALFPGAEGAGVALSAAGGHINRTAQRRAGQRQAATGERRAATGERRAGTYAHRAETERSHRRAQAVIGAHRAQTERGRRRAEAYTSQYNAETGRMREERLGGTRRRARSRPATGQNAIG